MLWVFIIMKLWCELSCCWGFLWKMDWIDELCWNDVWFQIWYGFECLFK